MSRLCLLVLSLLLALKAPNAFAQTDALSITPKQGRRPWANCYVTSTSAVPLKKGEGYLDGGFNGELLAPMATLALPLTSWLSFQAGTDPFVFLGSALSYDGQLTMGKAIKPNSAWSVGATYRIIGWTTPRRDYWNYHNYKRMSALVLTTYQTSEFSISAGLGSERKPDYDPTFFFSSFGSPYPLRHYWMPSAVGMGSFQLGRHFQLAAEIHVAVTPQALTNRGEVAISLPKLHGRREVSLRYFGKRWAGQLAFINEGSPILTSPESIFVPDLRLGYQIGNARK